MPAPALLPTPPSPVPASRLRGFARELALHDGLLIAYLAIFLLVALVRGEGAARTTCLLRLGAIGLVWGASMAAVRARPGRESTAALLAYRFATVALTPSVYVLVLGTLLPIANPATLDPALRALDERLFGVEPTLFLDRGFIYPFATEWFAFFYYGYFFYLGIHAVPMLFTRLAVITDFGLTVLLTFCVGHVVYMLVPGYGPLYAIADAFQHPLPEGFWYRLVLDTVGSGSAQKDLFPSLHTGGTMTVAIFCFRHRRLAPFKYTWPVTAFFALNTMGATIYLRWHWAIDVVAGLALVIAANVVSPRIAARERARRERLGLAPAWPPLPWPRARAA